jgi:hypothetical protein
MTVQPIRPEAPVRDIYPAGPQEPETTEVVKYENPLLLLIAWLLFALGWVVGLVSIPLNWTRGALLVGWDSARRLGGI